MLRVVLARSIRCICRLAIKRLKKAAPSLDMQDAHRLGGRGKLADRNLVKGPTSKFHFMASLCGAGVEYFCQIAATCLKMITNPIHCRSRDSGSCFPSPVRKSSTTHWLFGKEIRRRGAYAQELLTGIRRYPAVHSKRFSTSQLDLIVGPCSATLAFRLSILSAPAPNATIWSSPPAIITFLRKWIIWFWSAKLLWNETAVASEN
jgi:hypothetical protein